MYQVIQTLYFIILLIYLAIFGGMGGECVSAQSAASFVGIAGKQCFTEGTQIVVGAEFTEDDVFANYVTVSIEDIEVGDLVYSYDTVTGEVTQQEVTATFVLESDHLNYLTIVDEGSNEQIIETTDSHPFWVVTNEPDLERVAREVVDENGVIIYHENLNSNLNGFWVEAKDLQEGDVFLGANGELSTLVATERVVFPDGVKVYNFTVAGNHDYYVIAETDEFGQTSILVHNSCRANNKVRPDTQATGAHTAVHRDAQGHVTHYAEYTPNPRNSTGFDEVKRVDTQYVHPHSHDGIPTPHTHIKDKIRAAFPDELPE